MIPEPMLCSAADKVPDSDDWIAEPKLDGWRVMAHVTDSVGIFARSHRDYSGKVPYIEQALMQYLPHDTIVDGEIVGKNWGNVQSTMSRNGSHVPSLAHPALSYVIFDVLRVLGQDIRQLSWDDRRKILEEADLPGDGPVQLSLVSKSDPVIHERLIERGFEGSVCKLRRSHYTSGRSSAWVKVKPQRTIEAMVIGFKPGEGEFEGMPGAIEFQLENGEVSRCSGMDMDLRADMGKHPERYIGRIIEIGHEAETAAGKLRFPRFKRVRTDLRRGKITP